LGIASESVINNFLNLIKNNEREAIFTEVDAIAEQGIDLHNFAKQTLMYIDQYLHDDTDFLLGASEIFTDIIATVKYYPYPAIVYKVAINKFLNPSVHAEIPVVKHSPVQSTPAEVAVAHVETVAAPVAEG